MRRCYSSNLFVADPSCWKGEKPNQWINLYPVENKNIFPTISQLDSDLSGGKRCRTLEQLGPDL